MQDASYDAISDTVLRDKGNMKSLLVRFREGADDTSTISAAALVIAVYII